MTKTPEEIIDEGWANDEIVCGWDVRTILDQAGWAIVPKEPTDQMRRIAAEYLGFDPSEPKGLAESVRISLWAQMITAAQTQETRQSED